MLKKTQWYWLLWGITMTVKYVLKNLFRSELDNKVLEYVKELGHPEEITYGQDGSYFTAVLTYSYGKETKNENTQTYHS